jgi:transcription initiation factor TFIIH subunit 2
MSTAPAAAAAADAAAGASSHVWEELGEQSWETAVREDAEGRLIVTNGAESTAEQIRRRRKRLEQNDYAQRNRRVVRDMIRYVYVVIDASRWVRDKDPALPGGSKLDVLVQMLQEFVQEYYDQNPLSHLGFVILKNGEAEVLTQLSSSSKAHKLALTSLSEMVNAEGPSEGGEFSLQNGLEVAGRSLGHQPRSGSREVVVVCGALSTCDPGHVLTETLPRLQAAHIRVSTFALSAEIHVCRKLAEETGGVMGVCLDKAHLRDWLLGQCVPPPALREQHRVHACEMVQMGFPTRTKAEVPTLVHASRDTKLLARTAYTCPQCQAKVSELPNDCVVCGLKLVLSPHLARSFHHLFPVSPFEEVMNDQSERGVSALAAIASATSSSTVQSSSTVTIDEVIKLNLGPKLLRSSKESDKCCFACLRMVGVTIPSSDPNKDEGEEVLRFKCPDCENIFCVDCDTFLHETLHNCPGCLAN